MSSPETNSLLTQNFHVSDHFLYSDFICPCCDRLKIIPAFYRHIGLLEQIRREAGFPILVNSGYRCPKHNKEVGGAADSWHLLFATDIRPEGNDPEKLRALYRAALGLDFGGIGLYDTFLHLDLRPEKTRWRG
jgi:uncharacterized protein YcbK (DUF882 family)